MFQNVYHVMLLTYLVTFAAPVQEDGSHTNFTQTPDNVSDTTVIIHLYSAQTLNFTGTTSPALNVTEAPPLDISNTTAPINKFVQPSTTENICIGLCSMQLGGDACNCDFPSLPG